MRPPVSRTRTLPSQFRESGPSPAPGRVASFIVGCFWTKTTSENRFVSAVTRLLWEGWRRAQDGKWDDARLLKAYRLNQNGSFFPPTTHTHAAKMPGLHVVSPVDRGSYAVRL